MLTGTCGEFEFVFSVSGRRAGDLTISFSDLARLTVAAVASSLVPSGGFLVQYHYFESLPEVFCCASNFASF